MSRTRGFTLVEVLVALTVLAIAAALSYRALDLFRGGASRLTADGRALGELVSVFARIQLDVERAVNIRLVDRHRRVVPLLRTAEDPASGESAPGFDLVRAGADDLAGARRVSYRLRGSTLEYGLWPDAVNMAASPKTYKLVDGVKAYRVRFLDAQGRWLAAWNDRAEALPRAIQVELDLEGVGLVQRVFALP